MNQYKMAVPCHFGLEKTVKYELIQCGGKEVTAQNGRVLFQGNEDVMAMANVCCQSGERVLLVLGEFNADTFEALFTGTKQIPWEQFIGKKDAFPVTGWSIQSALHSVPDCQKIIKKAVVERLKTVYRVDWFEETGSTVQIRFSILKNTACLMIDTSGVPLHKRGYRAVSNEAPIKETLAAGIADIVRVFPDSYVIDPFCGSGTILIEAAMKAMRVAPGLNRTFAAQQYGFIDNDCFVRAKEHARSCENRTAGFSAKGYDIDPAAVEISKDNLKKAGFSDCIRVEKADIRSFEAPEKRCKIICNPPYGERLLDQEQSIALYRVMGKVFTPLPHASYAIITSNEEFEDYFGRKAAKKRKLYNGMLKCDLYQYF